MEFRRNNFDWRAYIFIDKFSDFVFCIALFVPVASSQSVYCK